MKTLMPISLDPIRDDLITWTESLYLPDTGAFRNGDAPVLSLPSTLFITYILYSINALDAVALDRAKWVAWIQSQQNEQDGSFAFPPSDRRGIAFWNAVRALNMLGSQVLRFPDDQRSATTVAGLSKWFKTWKASGDTHQFAATVQTYALLYEALPQRFTTSHPWRFGWSNRAFWQCRVIEDSLNAENEV